MSVSLCGEKQDMDPPSLPPSVQTCLPVAASSTLLSARIMLSRLPGRNLNEEKPRSGVILPTSRTSSWGRQEGGREGGRAGGRGEGLSESCVKQVREWLNLTFLRK